MTLRKWFAQYNKMSTWAKILLFAGIWVIIVNVVKINTAKSSITEGFTQTDSFLFKTGPDIYDDFYASIYDYLMFSSVKNDFEVGEIVNQTHPTAQSRILDIGCGTGRHVSQLAEKGVVDIIGVDVSDAMVKRAKNMYPNQTFMKGDVGQRGLFERNSFTHVSCLYFTVYYIQDKAAFFRNCYEWLLPGGYFIIHLVDRDKFDPILPLGNPLMLISPQRYAKTRLAHTYIKFDDFVYTADFTCDNATNKAVFAEKFEDETGKKARKQEHELFMEDITEIAQQIEGAGFVIHSISDMVKCQYEYQYLYVYVKPDM